MTVEAKRDALRTVLDAARIHSQSLTKSLTEERLQTGFKDARKRYIRNLDAAILETQAIRLDDEATIMQRVRDLSLEESTDLLISIMDHIRTLRGR